MHPNERFNPNHLSAVFFLAYIWLLYVKCMQENLLGIFVDWLVR